jgi:hypothetical protein
MFQTFTDEYAYMCFVFHLCSGNDWAAELEYELQNPGHGVTCFYTFLM